MKRRRARASEPTKLGQFVLRRMGQLDIHQAELADRAGVSNSTVSRWIYSPGIPTPASVRKLADALDVPYADLWNLVYGEPEPPGDEPESVVKDDLVELFSQLPPEDQRRVFALYELLADRRDGSGGAG